MNQTNNIQNNSCVYYHIDEYESHIPQYKIHKVLKYDFWLENEIKNQKKIINIDNWQDFFYTFQSASKLELTNNVININNQKELVNDNNVNNIQLLEYNDLELKPFKRYLKQLSNPTKYISSIIKYYKDVLQSLLLLDANKLVHNNITFDTLEIDKNENILLSNFSCSINLESLNTTEYIYSFISSYEPEYIEWAPELHIISYIVSKNIHSLSNYNLEIIMQNIIDNNHILKTFGNPIIYIYKTEALNYFEKYVNKDKHFIINDIFKHHNTWDNYSLSILFLRILISINNGVETQNKFILYFMKLLVTNIHLSPVKRLSLQQSFNNYENILNTLKIDDYKDLINKHKLMLA